MQYDQRQAFDLFLTIVLYKARQSVFTFIKLTESPDCQLVFIAVLQELLELQVELLGPSELKKLGFAATTLHCLTR